MKAGLACVLRPAVQIHALGYKIRKDSFEAAAIPPEALPNYSEPEIRNYWFTLS